MHSKTTKKLEQLRRLMGEAVPLPGAPLEATRPAIPARPGGMDPITRDAYLRRVRFLRDRHNLRWLVDETTGYVTTLDCLEDAELVRLQAVLDRAYCAIRDGVPLDDVGLAPASWEIANHLSPTPLGGQEVSIHVSPDPAPTDAQIPWWKRPENQF